MKPGWILGVGALFCTAVAVLSRIWLPYTDSGVSYDMYHHVAASAGVILSMLLFFGYLAMGFPESDGASAMESYGSLVTATFLGLSALVTMGFFVWTYWGLSYQLFWGVQILQIVILGVIWTVSTKAVAPMAAVSEGNAKVVGIRKQGVIDSLLDASSACQQIDSDSTKTLKKGIDKLQDELKFLPKHVTGAEAVELMSELNNLIQEINDAVKTTLKDDQSKVLVDQLLLKINATQRHVAQWKRV